nr:hypothetical protein [Tanacetum cinerariifolium]
ARRLQFCAVAYRNATGRAQRALHQKLRFRPFAAGWQAPAARPRAHTSGRGESYCSGEGGRYWAGYGRRVSAQPRIASFSGVEPG